jgi:hypothetical protein
MEESYAPTIKTGRLVMHQLASRVSCQFNSLGRMAVWCNISVTVYCNLSPSILKNNGLYRNYEYELSIFRTKYTGLQILIYRWALHCAKKTFVSLITDARSPLQFSLSSISPAFVNYWLHLTTISLGFQNCPSFWLTFKISLSHRRLIHSNHMPQSFHSFCYNIRS